MERTERIIAPRDLHEDYETTLRDYMEIETARHNHLENRCALRGVVRAFKILEREADNGFGNIDLIRQTEILINRTRQIEDYLHNCCFYEEDLVKVRTKIQDIVYRSLVDVNLRRK